MGDAPENLITTYTMYDASAPHSAPIPIFFNQAAAQAQTLEYGNTASLRAVVDSCSTLTNARLVHLMLGPYRLKSHLRVLKKFLLHGQVCLSLPPTVHNSFALCFLYSGLK